MDKRDKIEATVVIGAIVVAFLFLPIFWTLLFRWWKYVDGWLK